MQPNESSNLPSSNETFHDKVRSKLNEHLLLALPIALINGVVVWIMNRFFSQPWQILWFAVPLAVISFFAWRRITGHPNVKIGISFLLLFASYVLIFSLTAWSELLNWKRSLEGYNSAVPRNFLSLNWLGDWRYWFVKQTEPDTDFAVVFMPPGENIDVGRVHVAQLIQVASTSGIKGIAFDFHFRDNANSAVDEKLCNAIRDAETRVPVFMGHGFDRKGGEMVFTGVAQSLQICIAESRLGHTVAYAEFDNKIRLIPLYFKNISERESLSLKIARQLRKDLPLPESRLVQFIKPAANFPEIEFDDLDREKGRLKDRFLLVGERKDTDSWRTPYGTIPGVIIHSYVVHSLRRNYFMQRVPWWTSLTMVFAVCFLVLFFFAQGWRRKKIVLWLIGMSILICVLSVLAARFWLIWLDVIYPLLALWFFFILMVILSRVRQVSTPPQNA